MKMIQFTDSDNDKLLVARIKEYADAHGISSFIGAVRQLCNIALEVEKIRH